MDQLEQLFHLQATLQKRLNNKFDQQYINTMTIAAIDELMEAIRETPWKPWKKQQTLNQEAFKEELVDVWHFIINLTLASNMTAEELFERFRAKNIENHNRQDQNY